MSFGTSVRFEVAQNQGKPSIYWQKEGIQQKPKKFGYKSKELRHPLRKGVENEEGEPAQARPADIEKQKKKVLSTKKASDFGKENDSKRLEKHPAANSVSLTQNQLNTILASVGRLGGSKENGLRISIDSEKNGIQIENTDKAINETNRSLDQAVKERSNKKTHDTELQVSSYSFLNGELVDDKTSNDRNNEKKTSGSTGLTKDPQSGASRLPPNKVEESSVSQAGVDSNTSALSPRRLDGLPFVVSSHLTVAEKKRLQWARERAEQVAEETYDPWGRPGAGAPIRGEDGQALTDYKTRQEEILRKSHDGNTRRQVKLAAKIGEPVSSSISTDNRLSDKNNNLFGGTSNHNVPQPSSKGFLTYGENDLTSPVNRAKEEERKRWVEELDKQREEKRLQKIQEKHEDAAFVDVWNDKFSKDKKPAQLPTQSAIKQLSVQESPREKTMGKDYDKNPPAAMRSSFIIGQLAPNENRYQDKKSEEKRRWIADLDKQMEEKRLQKALEKQKEAVLTSDTWADRLSYDQPKPAPAQLLSSLTPDFTVTTGRDQNMTARVNSAPQTSEQNQDIQESRSFLRGQNVIVDAATQKEIEEKRRRHIEYQMAIKKQIEEKQRIKDMEREQERLEEMAEERRLQAERIRTQQQYAQDLQKQREREEDRQNKINQLKSRMDAAQERANKEKMLQRIRNLQLGGHDVSHLQAKLEVPDANNRLTALSEFIPAELALISPVNNIVETTRVPGISPRDISGALVPFNPSLTASTGSLINHAPYTENRLLTPSCYRNLSQPHSDPLSPKREFGTQTIGLETDGSLLQWKGTDVEIEYHPHKNNHQREAGAMKKPTEVQQKRDQPKAANQLKNSMTHNRDVLVKKIHKERQEKPKGPQVWNYNNPYHKRSLKQSEKDPFFEQRKQEGEERRAKRERRLLAMVEINKPVVPDHLGETRTLQKSEVRKPGRQVTEDSERSEQEKQRNEARFTATRDLAIRSLTPAVPEMEGPQNQPEHLQLTQAHHRTAPSPPIPSVRHRTEGQQNPKTDVKTDSHQADPQLARHTHLTHYMDIDPLAVPNGEFVPFLRTSEVLDPKHAIEPMQMSRENTQLQNARKAYIGSRNPASFGQAISIHQDSEVYQTKDPILNPDLVKGHPTARQDMILQQLSTLKQSLMQRQRELETCMSPTSLDQQS